MLKPSGPNLRRSCSRAWKKQMPKRSFLNGRLLGLRVEVGVRVAEVGHVQVGLDAARRLDGHLDRVLQDRDREEWRGHRGEPEPVVSVHLVGTYCSTIASSLGIHDAARWQF